jgi:hypothetical protein
MALKDSKIATQDSKGPEVKSFFPTKNPSHLNLPQVVHQYPLYYRYSAHFILSLTTKG